MREKFGKDAKIVDAKFVDAEQGNFTGTVVAQDDDRVIQRIGANKFIAHERSALDGGDVGIGQFVKVQYNQGKAIVQARSDSSSKTPMATRPRSRDRVDPLTNRTALCRKARAGKGQRNGKAQPRKPTLQTTQ